MIIIKVELHSAITGKTTEIGRMEIINDGSSDDAEVGNYNINLMRRGTTKTIQRRARVENHKRKNNSVWNLISKGLKNLGI